MDGLFWGGDFVLLTGDSWEGCAFLHYHVFTIRTFPFNLNILNFSYALGLVQGWDGDNGFSYGASSRPDYSKLNLLVCVSQDAIADERCGWLPSSINLNGQRIVVSLLGNTMTSIRECQALASLKTISKGNRGLVELILNPAEIVKQIQGRKDIDGPVTRPKSVPLALWDSLTKEFNESQLKAIKIACGRQADTELGLTDLDLPIKLLQGPPGTGKTKVILGLVSVFLAGALDKRIRAGTKVSNTSHP
jgi:hypothetical protein